MGFLDLRFSVLPTLGRLRSAQFFGALLIVAHPAAFFLVAGYSESLFLMALLGFIYWSGGETRRGQDRGDPAWHGHVSHTHRGSALRAGSVGETRVGNRCAQTFDFRAAWQNYGDAALLSLSAMLGGLGFFAYCQLRWGHWDIYMLTQRLGWGIEPDYLAIFKPSSYHWLFPALDNPTEASQMTMTLGGLMLLGVIAFDFLRHRRKNSRTFWPHRVLFRCVHLYFLSVSRRGGRVNGKYASLRILRARVLVLALLHYLANVPLRSRLGRAGAVTAIALASMAGLALESWYVWNFTRGNWVA